MQPIVTNLLGEKVILEDMDEKLQGVIRAVTLLDHRIVYTIEVLEGANSGSLVSTFSKNFKIYHQKSL